LGGRHDAAAKALNTVTAKDGVEIFYKDWGPGDTPPIVVHHGWPLCSDDRDARMLIFVGKGYRVVCTTHAEVINADRHRAVTGSRNARPNSVRSSSTLGGTRRTTSSEAAPPPPTLGGFDASAPKQPIMIRMNRRYDTNSGVAR
jgi:hypothetical protein